MYVYLYPYIKLCVGINHRHPSRVNKALYRLYAESSTAEGTFGLRSGLNCCAEVTSSWGLLSHAGKTFK